jgi:hypothetical protein
MSRDLVASIPNPVAAAHRLGPLFALRRVFEPTDRPASRNSAASLSTYIVGSFGENPTR